MLLGSSISGLILLAGLGYWGWHLIVRKNYRGKQLLKYGWPIIVGLFVSIGLIGNTSTANATPEPKVKVETVKKVRAITVKNDRKLLALQKANSSSASSLKTETADLAKEKSKIDQTKAKNQQAGATKETATTSVKIGESPSATSLANMAYTGQQTIVINHNHPAFSSADLATDHGTWQRYGNLDQLNRVTAANALLSQSLMPKAKREALNVNPTGWRNKQLASGWLYNRSHLIGYQLTGQNNNPKNLMTGTRSLNAPEMVTYENQVADYLKANPKNYVRYQVTPVFKDNELLARGVQMRGQSVGSDAVSFNIYIFNVQAGMTLNYNDGTSRVAK
ncbi:DNA/RNA non-specific endonuclease [Lactiplantibacillus brownii]|uniref:DNA/RNA non-specific endonuclease n=1 Tax=Lactiplantibacillus brownii TaxID=3069269 RepID=UPI00389955D9